MVKTDALLSRRKLLVIAGVAGTAAAAALTPLRTVLINATRDLVKKQPALRRWMMPLAQAGYDDWLEQVGATFAVGGGTSLKLAGVRAFAARGTRPSGLSRDRAFVALFDVQNRRTLAGDLIYTVTHPTQGALQLFLTASDPRTPGRMLAVLN